MAGLAITDSGLMFGRIRSYGAAAVVAVGAAVIVPARLRVSGQSDTPAERVMASAINLDRGAAGTIEISGERWSSRADRDRLMTVAFDKGPDKLLDVLQDLPRVCYFRTSGQ